MILKYFYIVSDIIEKSIYGLNWSDRIKIFKVSIFNLLCAVDIFFFLLNQFLQNLNAYVYFYLFNFPREFSMKYNLISKMWEIWVFTTCRRALAHKNANVRLWSPAGKRLFIYSHTCSLYSWSRFFDNKRYYRPWILWEKNLLKLTSHIREEIRRFFPNMCRHNYKHSTVNNKWKFNIFYNFTENIIYRTHFEIKGFLRIIHICRLEWAVLLYFEYRYVVFGAKVRSAIVQMWSYASRYEQKCPLMDLGTTEG